ncbi:MAG: hypothetical protein O2856_10970 [Planctomycetota bacterium]|nr:hypothetical protein [Planctomycetota bacterium]
MYAPPKNIRKHFASNSIRFDCIAVFVAILLGSGATATMCRAEDDAPQGPRRHAIPGSDALQEAKKAIDDVYGSRYKQAHTIEGNSKLASDLFNAALESGDQVAIQYALLRDSYAYALEAKDTDLVMQVIAETTERFEMDRLVAEASAISALSLVVRDAAAAQNLFEHAQRLVDACLSAEAFANAERVAVIADSLARRTKEPDLVRTAVARQKDIQELRKRYQMAERAKEILTDRPDDPEANLIVGLYHWLNRDDLQKAASNLALGSNENYRSVAKLELNKPSSVADQLALADAWWEVSERSADKVKGKAIARAVYWYRSLLPGLSGFSRQRVTQRIDAGSGNDDSDEWVDLLPKLDLTQHRVAGPWNIRQGALITTKAPVFSRVMLPSVPRRDYELDIAFVCSLSSTNERGWHKALESFYVILPVGSHQCVFGVSGNEAGIARIKDKGWGKNSTYIDYRGISSRAHRLSIKVVYNATRASISSKMDGKAFVNWEGNPSDLSVYEDWSLPNRNAIGLSATLGSVRFERVRLREIQKQ